MYIRRPAGESSVIFTPSSTRVTRPSFFRIRAERQQGKQSSSTVGLCYLSLRIFAPPLLLGSYLGPARYCESKLTASGYSRPDSRFRKLRSKRTISPRGKETGRKKSGYEETRNSFQAKRKDFVHAPNYGSKLLPLTISDNARRELFVPIAIFPQF